MGIEHSEIVHASSPVSAVGTYHARQIAVSEYENGWHTFRVLSFLWMVCACTKDRGYFTNRDDKLLTMPALMHQLCRGRLYGPLTIAIIDCVWYAQATSMLKSDIFILFLDDQNIKRRELGEWQTMSVSRSRVLCARLHVYLQCKTSHRLTFVGSVGFCTVFPFSKKKVIEKR